MSYWNRNELVDRCDLPGFKPYPSNGQSHDEWQQEQLSSWVDANDQASDYQIVDEIHTWLNEAVDRDYSDAYHYILKAEQWIELFKARFELEKSDYYKNDNVSDEE